MSNKMYPLKFDPIYEYRIWGGRKLENLMSKPLPGNDPVGEAWLLSDREDMPSTVIEENLKDQTLPQLMKDYRYEIMGKLGNDFEKFPLLLKFLDCKEVLSVQVHPSDDQKEYIPPGDTGKTEAWIVLDTSEDSCIYSGLKPGTTEENLLQSISDKKVAERLHSFVPKKDDAIFIHSGTVHTLGGTLVFEVQENSDTTYRLYDWDRTDPKTGQPRDLQVEKAIACIDFDQIDIGPVKPVKDNKFKNGEKLFDNDHFVLWRIKEDNPFNVGIPDEPVILVCIEGKGTLNFNNQEFALNKGEVILLPAIIGVLPLQPSSNITVLQIAIPNKK